MHDNTILYNKKLYYKFHKGQSKHFFNPHPFVAYCGIAYRETITVKHMKWYLLQS